MSNSIDKKTLKGVDLSEANLSEAYLRGANLTGANLRGANLTAYGIVLRGIDEVNKWDTVYTNGDFRTVGKNLKTNKETGDEPTLWGCSYKLGYEKVITLARRGENPDYYL